MYYDRLKARVKTAVAVKEAQKADRIDILDLIAPCYHPLHDEVLTGAYTTFHLPGGRGSCKSSFVEKTLRYDIRVGIGFLFPLIVSLGVGDFGSG